MQLETGTYVKSPTANAIRKNGIGTFCSKRNMFLPSQDFPDSSKEAPITATVPAGVNTVAVKGTWKGGKQISWRIHELFVVVPEDMKRRIRCSPWLEGYPDRGWENEQRRGMRAWKHFGHLCGSSEELNYFQFCNWSDIELNVQVDDFPWHTPVVLTRRVSEIDWARFSCLPVNNVQLKCCVLFGDLNPQCLAVNLVPWTFVVISAFAPIQAHLFHVNVRTVNGKWAKIANIWIYIWIYREFLRPLTQSCRWRQCCFIIVNKTQRFMAAWVSPVEDKFMCARH